MTATPWPTQGPAARDELSALSTVMLSEHALGPVPPLATPGPPGRTELIDGGGVYVRHQEGPPGAVPVWFVHGLGGASTDWTRLGSALSTLAPGYALDLPGSGRSDPPPGERYSPVVDAAATAAAIDRAGGGPVHLVGNSYGGVVATLVAARRPDLIGTLTLLSPAVPDLRLTKDRGADARLGLLLLPGTAALAATRLATIPPLERARGLGDMCFGNPDAITDDDYLALAQEHTWRAALPWAHAATIGSLRGLMKSYLRTGRDTFSAAAAQVVAPVLVIWGTRDRLVDVRLAPRAVAAFGDAELLVLRGCGHVPQMEEPLLTAQAIAGHWERASAARTAPDNDGAGPGDHAQRALSGAPEMYGSLSG
jgi:pimeloyl-ACP methyl ester carboxylesterase